MNIKIKNIEYYLPPKTENMDDLRRDNPAWPMEQIKERTGVSTRHISSGGETALDMGASAAEKLFSSGVRRGSIDLLIFVTQSPDYALPTSACILQDRLRLGKKCMAFDINLGCSGYIYGLAAAGGIINAGLAKNGLLICADTYTKYIDKSDRTCRPLFSDGAAATFLVRSDKDDVGSFEAGTDGSGYCDLIVPSSGARSCEGNSGGKLYMNGPKVFMFSMRTVPDRVKSLLKKSKRTIGDIDMFIFHQASKVVMDNIIRKLKIPEKKVFMNYQRIGNTVSASIPIALKDASDKRLLKKGADVLLFGFGVGYSWGGCIIKYGGIL